MTLVINTKTHMWLLIMLFGAGTVMMIVLWNTDKASSENYSPPQANGIDQSPDQDSRMIANNNSFQSSDQPTQPVITPVNRIDRSNLDEIRSAVDANLTEGDETFHDENQIYTMDTLPQDKSGSYWVRDSDGNLNQIAVDIPGPDSAIGL